MSTYPSDFLPDIERGQAARTELGAAFHEEITRLPDKYRIPVILSYLEGKTGEEVAELLGLPVGCVQGRLARARSLLRSRLTRRGAGLSAAFLLTALADGTVFAEAVPAKLIEQTMLLIQGLFEKVRTERRLEGTKAETRLRS